MARCGVLILRDETRSGRVMNMSCLMFNILIRAESL